jgi:undecaprenyl-diphosphatase
MPTFVQIVILAVIQGLAELLPVSSSAHVIAGAKLMHVDPTTPQFTLLLVMLHTGTMFAVILYFWKAWQKAFFSSRERFIQSAKLVLSATVVTGVIALGLKFGIEKIIKHRNKGIGKAEIEQLFKHLELLAASLAAAGVLILVAGLRSRKSSGREEITQNDALSIGAMQGLCLPFRGFSRSGATISTGLLRGVSRIRLEEYSFALAVVLTPAVILWEAKRLVEHHGETGTAPLGLHDFTPSLIGMVFSFLGGLVALKVLSGLLEHGKWWVFGVYCLLASAAVFAMYLNGY